MGQSSFLAYSELMGWISEFADQNQDIVLLKTIGRSNEGRDVQAVEITDRNLPIENKEVVLIILGRHGDEIGTNVVGNALLQWLALPEAAHYLKAQHILIVPTANPDGCFKKKFGLPVDRLSAFEKDSFIEFGLKYIPDVVVDVHSVGEKKNGFNWGGLEAVVVDENANEGEDALVLRKMADKMIEGASVAGFPFLLHTTEYYKNLRAIVGKLRESGFNNYANRVFYDAFHSLTFGVEVNHYVLSPEETAQSGLSVIQALLEMGLQTFPWEYYPGYPNRIICGDFLASIRPYGKTSSERRASRKELWLNRHNFEQPYNPYRKMLDKNSVDIIFKYSGEKMIENGLTVGVRMRGKTTPQKVFVNGESVNSYWKTDECSIYVWIDFFEVLPHSQQEIHIEF